MVVIEFTDGINRKYEVKTNKKGEFIQIGLAPGNYKVTASFEGLGAESFPVRVRLGDPPKLKFKLGAATGADQGGRRQGRGPEEGVRRGRGAQQGRQVRRGHRQVHRGLRHGPGLLRLLLQHRLQPRPEEGLRPGRGGVPEGHRDEGGLRRGLQRPGDGLQRPEEVRQGAGGELEGRRTGQRGRPGGRRQRRRGRRVQPGRHPLERRQDRRGGRALPEGDLHEAGPRRRALPARHGLREPGQAGRSGADVREVPGTGARPASSRRRPRACCRASRSRAGMEIPSRRDEIAAGLSAVRHRLARASRAGRPFAFFRQARGRLEDPPGRRRAGGLRRRAGATSARTASRRRWRRSPRRPICRSRGTWSATCSRTRPGRPRRRSPGSTRSTASTC